MKLFRRKKKQPVERLIGHLEKIGKIAALRIDKDYTDPVIEDLKWVEDSFIKILKLYETNKEHFKALLDAKGRFTIRPAVELNFTDADFSAIATAFSEDEPAPAERSYRKRYVDFDRDPENEDLIQRYISTVFQVWNAAFAKENFRVQRFSLYIYANWIFILDPLSQPDFDYKGILNEFLINLTRLNRETLQDSGDKPHAFSSFLNYNLYLNNIFSKDVNLQNVDMYFEYLFRNLQQAISLNQMWVVRNFIERVTDSGYAPSSNSLYSDLFSQLSRKSIDAGTYEQTQPILRQIPHIAGYQIQFINTFEQYEEWKIKFNNFLQEQVYPVIQENEVIRLQVIRIEGLALKYLKFNKLRITLIKLLAYAVFKGDLSLLEHAFTYNQPSDSNAWHGNREILPNTLSDILNVTKEHQQMEYELLSYWEGHHGIELYLNFIFINLLDRYRPRNEYLRENARQTAIGFSKDALADDPGRVSGFDHYVERLSGLLNYFTARPEYRSIFQREGRTNENISQIFAQFREGFASALTEIERRGIITPQTSERFLNGIIEEYYKYNYLLRLFHRFRKTDDVPEPTETLGINELMDRTAFVENWHIPYIGYIESAGRGIAESENRDALFSIDRAVDESRISIKSRENAITWISEITSRDHIIIIRNAFVEEIMNGVEDFTSIWNANAGNQIIENFHVGNYKNTPVFRIYDPLFNDSIAIINTKTFIGASSDPGEINEPFTGRDGFKSSFIDLANDEETKQQFIENPPAYLQEEFAGQAPSFREFLEKKVWVRLLKKSSFITRAQTDNYLINLK